MDSTPREEQLTHQWRLNFYRRNREKIQCTIVVSLDVKGAFDTACWPSILRQLRGLKCPTNLYNLSLSYFRNRKASLREHNYKKEKQVQKGCPQGFCSGPGLWNFMYNSFLNLEFNSPTKVMVITSFLRASLL
jgi:hypothetical protein